MEKSNKDKGEIIIYKTPKGPELKVRLQKEMIWLTQKQIAELFEVNIPAISKHVNNIFQEKELPKKATVSKMETVQKEGERVIKRKIEFFNLDMVIAVGYRVNSRRATQFRIWATKTLKEHLIQGYTVNEKRLLQQSDKLRELQGTIEFLQKKSKHELLENQSQEILNLLANYAKSLSLLEQYDKKKLTILRGVKAKFVLVYEQTKEIIEQIKNELAIKKEASDLFGAETGHKLESIVKNLYQTFGGKELYKSGEEKAAHLLYLIIKDHPFVDGNKRVASFLFVYFLDKNDYLYKDSGEKKINDNALVALALLIATSDPKEKDTMIGLITNLLK